MARPSSRNSGKRGVKLGGKRGGKKMKGGVSTSDNAIGVFGGIGQQHAAVASDNTIAMKQMGGLGESCDEEATCVTGETCDITTKQCTSMVGGGMWVPATLLAANELYKRYGKKKGGSRKGGADVLVPAALLALEEINKRRTRKNGGSRKGKK